MSQRPNPTAASFSMSDADEQVANLLDAIQNMDVDKAQAALKFVDPNSRDVDHPLPWRLIRGRPEGATLMHEAVLYSSERAGFGNDLRIVQMLLDAGAVVNSKNHKGFTPLHNAATVNNVPACRALLENGADIDVQSLEGYSPFQAASANKATQACGLLIARGCDLDLPNHHGENALTYAKRKGHDEITPLIEIAQAQNLTIQLLMDMDGEAEHEHLSSHNALEAHERASLSTYLAWGTYAELALTSKPKRKRQNP